MPNVYVSLETLKGSGALNLTATAWDGRLLALAESVSRQIDRETRRYFFQLEETRTFDGPGDKELELPDLIAMGTLQEDTNYDGTYETNWAATDFILWPLNAAPTQKWGRPYTRVLVNPNSNGSQDTFLKGVQNYRVLTGTWGFRRDVNRLVLTGTIADTTATTLILSGSATGTVSAGDTIWYGTLEQMYVSTASATILTVVRGVNGSTLTTGTAKVIDLFLWPSQIVEAALIQTARLWKRKDSAFANEIGMPETGQMIVWRGGLDSDARSLVSPFQRLFI